MYTTLLILLLIDCFVLVVVVLLQAGKGGGLAAGFGGAGTGTFELEGASGVFNELQAGSYVFMDADYARNKAADGAPFSTFEHALFVYVTVMSAPVPERAVVDAGFIGHAGARRVVGRDHHERLIAIANLAAPHGRNRDGRARCERRG